MDPYTTDRCGPIARLALGVVAADQARQAWRKGRFVVNAVKRRLSEIEWTSKTRFRLDGIDFALEEVGDPRRGDALPVMKPVAYFRSYAEIIRDAPTRNVLELGIHKGGSAVFLASLFRVEKLATLDLLPKAPRLDKFRRTHPLGARIAPYYETSQDDEAKLREIIDREFDGPFDLVIDDASHDYHLTKASFEILFPHLRSGGFYVIEDWQWAHTRGFFTWRDKPALSNLLFQLMMAQASRSDLIAKIHVYPGIAYVQKGSAAPSEARLDLEALCWTQGRTFQLL